MNGIEIIKELLKLGHIIKIKEDDYSISNKIIRSRESISTESVKPMKVDIDSAIKQFLADCKVPFRSTGPSGNKYIITQVTEYVKRYFLKLFVESKYPYDDIVAVTKKYYSESNSCRVTLNNFFKTGIFEQLMEEYVKRKSTIGDVSPKTNSSGRVSL